MGDDPGVKIDFGLVGAREFYLTIVAANVQTFRSAPNLISALNAAWVLWHIHDWHWHDIFPGRNPKAKKFRPDYKIFIGNLFSECLELKLVQDLCEGGKHCFLSRGSVSVKRVSYRRGYRGAGGYNLPSGGYGTGVAYSDGTPHLRIATDLGEAGWVRDAVDRADAYWKWKLSAAE